MIETKVMRIENTEECINQIGRERVCFGWTVTNVQVTHSENTKTYSSVWDQIGGNRSQTVETNIVDYATVTLQRDTALAHYMELVDLEEEYDELSEQAVNLRSAIDKKESGSWISDLAIMPWDRLLAKKLRKKPEEEAAQLRTQLEQVENRMEAVLRQGRSLL